MAKKTDWEQDAEGNWYVVSWWEGTDNPAISDSMCEATAKMVARRKRGESSQIHAEVVQEKHRGFFRRGR